MKKQQKNKKGGFTLVELVVVIAIIGVLAAVITPRVRNALVKAKDAKAVATLDGLRTAINVYHAETGNMIEGSDTTKKGTGYLTMKDIDDLKSAGYLDSTGGLKGTTGATPIASLIQIEVGSLTTANTDAACEIATKTPNQVLQVYIVDGTSLAFAATSGVSVTEATGVLVQNLENLYDTGCKLWKDK